MASSNYQDNQQNINISSGHTRSHSRAQNNAGVNIRDDDHRTPVNFNSTNSRSSVIVLDSSSNHSNRFSSREEECLLGFFSENVLRRRRPPPGIPELPANLLHTDNLQDILPSATFPPPPPSLPPYFPPTLSIADNLNLPTPLSVSHSNIAEIAGNPSPMVIHSLPPTNGRNADNLEDNARFSFSPPPISFHTIPSALPLADLFTPAPNFPPISSHSFVYRRNRNRNTTTDTSSGGITSFGGRDSLDTFDWPRNGANNEIQNAIRQSENSIVNAQLETNSSYNTGGGGGGSGRNNVLSRMPSSRNNLGVISSYPVPPTPHYQNIHPPFSPIISSNHNQGEIGQFNYGNFASASMANTYSNNNGSGSAFNLNDLRFTHSHSSIPPGTGSGFFSNTHRRLSPVISNSNSNRNNSNTSNNPLPRNHNFYAEQHYNRNHFDHLQPPYPYSHSGGDVQSFHQPQPQQAPVPNLPPPSVPNIINHNPNYNSSHTYRDGNLQESVFSTSSTQSRSSSVLLSPPSALPPPVPVTLQRSRNRRDGLRHFRLEWENRAGQDAQNFADLNAGRNNAAGEALPQQQNINDHARAEQVQAGIGDPGGLGVAAQIYLGERILELGSDSEDENDENEVPDDVFGAALDSNDNGNGNENENADQQADSDNELNTDHPESFVGRVRREISAQLTDEAKRCRLLQAYQEVVDRVLLGAFYRRPANSGDTAFADFLRNSGCSTENLVSKKRDYEMMMSRLRLHPYHLCDSPLGDNEWGPESRLQKRNKPNATTHRQIANDSSNASTSNIGGPHNRSFRCFICWDTPQSDPDMEFKCPPCGHIICNDCFTRYRDTRKVKCHYCQQMFKKVNAYKVFLN